MIPPAARVGSAVRWGWMGLAALVGTAPAGGAAAAPAFETQTLRVPGAVLWVDHGDLDGDGNRDLVVSYRRGGGPAAERFFAVFYRGAKGFGTRPSHAFRAPAGAVAFDLGPAPDGGRAELFLWAREGVFALAFAGREVDRPRALVTASSLAGAPESGDLPRWDFVRVVDGEPVIVLPTARGVRIHRRGEGGWTLGSTVPVRPIELVDAETDTFRPGEDGGAPVRNYALRVTRMVPKLTFIDQTGDGRSDLVSAFEDRIEVFAARKDGTFGVEPVFRRWFRLRTAEEIENRDATLYATVAHLDGDGVADLALAKSSGGLTTFRSEVRLHRGLEGGGFASEPTQTFEHGGIGSLVSFVDLDGDGRVEMLQPSAEISLAAMVRALFSKQFRVDVELRGHGGDDVPFETDPRQRLAARFDLDFSASAGVRGSPPLFGHDFDGDGRPDALVPDGGERMALHQGLADSERFFRTEAFVYVEGPGSGTTVVLEPGREDALPDVLVYYVGRDDLHSRLLVHLNRREVAARIP